MAASDIMSASVIVDELIDSVVLEYLVSGCSLVLVVSGTTASGVRVDETDCSLFDSVSTVDVDASVLVVTDSLVVLGLSGIVVGTDDVA